LKSEICDTNLLFPHHVHSKKEGTQIDE